jgi:tRNA(adenine34) deaminase
VTPAKKARKTPTKRTGRRWVAGVTTESTFPPRGLFTKDAATVARSLASKRVSPKGPASGMRMLNYFINRGGRGLSKTRRAELERAKRLLSERIRRDRERRERRKKAA